MSMPANSTSHGSVHKPPIVVVPANDQSLNYSFPPDQDPHTFGKPDAQQLKDRNLLAILKNTTINFEFNGTGIAVVGQTYDSFPPIPTKLLPSFKCMVDGRSTDSLRSHSPSHRGGLSDIPLDGGQLMCMQRKLDDRLHSLRIVVTVSEVPAFFGGIRIRPLPQNNPINLNDTFLRIDSRDHTYIQVDNQGWKYVPHGHDDDKTLESQKASGGALNITIPSNQVQGLKWFGRVKHVDHDHDNNSSLGSNLTTFLDGIQTQVPLKWGSSGVSELFELSMNSSDSGHVLTIPPPPGYQLALDHLMVTLGKPMVQNLMEVNNTGDPPGDHWEKKHLPVAVPIVSGIVGSIVVILATLLVVRCIQKRRRWRHTWKDSTLPPMIQHPGTRVSSRSSFSREVVTGDIEYNPEAQKKLESSFVTEVMEPPRAVILHTDSGYRLHDRDASEVPPHYTRG